MDIEWRRASFCSGGACVEVAFERSSYCTSATDCVEVARPPGAVLVRDGKDPDGPVLTFGTEGWNDFLRGVQNGEFDG